MRPTLHLPGLGHAFRVTGVMAKFVIWRAVLCLVEASFTIELPGDNAAGLLSKPELSLPGSQTGPITVFIAPGRDGLAHPDSRFRPTPAGGR